MTDCDDRYDTTCRGEFAELHAKLDRLDDSIRGNGRVGLVRRVDRLEQSVQTLVRALWLVLGASITVVVATMWAKMTG